MLNAAVITTDDELFQIHCLNRKNLKQYLDKNIREQEGFVTWLYSLDLLKKMHQLSPGIVVKNGNNVVAYALTTLKEAQIFHRDLEIMFENLQSVSYKTKPLPFYNFYCMGQICIAKEYRGKGLVNLLYQKHREIYGSQYDFILTEISTGQFAFTESS